MTGSPLEWLFEGIEDDLVGCFRDDQRDGRRADRAVDVRLPQDLFAGMAEGATNRRTSESENALLRAVRMGRKASSTFAGDLAAVPFPDVVVMLECSRKSGVLSVASPHAVAQLTFERGQLVHTVFGELTGNPAFYALMGESQGQFEFLPGSVALPEAQHNIDLSVTGLLMEGSRILDESTSKPGLSTETVSSPKTRVPRPAEIAPPAPPSRLSREVGQTLGDVAVWVRQSSTHGQARQWYAEDLAAALKTSTGRSQLRILVFTELGLGLPQIFPLSDAASLADLYSSIDPERGIFGLSFDYRKLLDIDVILADIWNLGRIKDALVRTPSIAVLTPPRGHLAEVGAAARVEIEILLDRLHPPGVLGVGQPSLERELQELFAASQRKVAVRTLSTGEDEGAFDMRDVIAESLLLYDQVRRTSREPR